MSAWRRARREVERDGVVRGRGRNVVAIGNLTCCRGSDRTCRRWDPWFPEQVLKSVSIMADDLPDHIAY
jgi:hypothetical protein